MQIQHIFTLTLVCFEASRWPHVQSDTLKRVRQLVILNKVEQSGRVCVAEGSRAYKRKNWACGPRGCWFEFQEGY